MSFLRRDKSKSLIHLGRAAGQHDLSMTPASPVPSAHADTVPGSIHLVPINSVGDQRPEARPDEEADMLPLLTVFPLRRLMPRSHTSPSESAAALQRQLPAVSRVNSGPNPSTLDQKAGAPAADGIDSAALGPNFGTFPPGARAQTEGFSPRLLVAGAFEEVVNDNYRGFHRNKGGPNVPPLATPIKPRFKKKGHGLLGKLIHKGKEDDDELRKSTSSASSKHKFRLPLISQSHDSRNPLYLEESALLAPSSHHALVSGPSISGPLGMTPYLDSASAQPALDAVSTHGGGGRFDLDLTFDELLTILKQPPQSRPALKLTSVPGSTQDVTTFDDHKHSAWKAPDSWDVTELAPGQGVAARTESESENDGPVREEVRVEGPVSLASSLSDDEKKHRKKLDESPFPKSIPLLYGTIASSRETSKGPNHIVRVFKEDNTFTTILCPMGTSTAELLAIIQRKFFFDSISNYQVSLYVGNNVKVLEPFEKPLIIQHGLLTLSGYTEKDNLRIIGREDMLSICKFVVENMFLRNLTHEEESVLSKDYVDVNISSHNLKTIPIIFHQHTYEIEKLNVSDNPAIYIPLDFIQSCTNLSSISFSRNGCSKFPLNLLEATGLKYLAMDANFLDEIPAKFSHLNLLETLKLNSNQLYTLPRSFEKLTNLVTLNLSSNYFQEYPECINELTLLQDLDLSYNDLSEIPESISKLTRLTKLNLSTNKLSKALPAHLKRLVNLKRLDIRYNRISNVDVLGSLPNLEVVYASKNSISRFSDRMESLRLLHFDRNPITSLEFEILLPMLTVLDLSKAKITAIPAEFIGKIPHVEKLVLDKNHLVTLPAELGNLPRLTHLSLYANNIQTLPDSIGNLSSLQYLDLHSNNIESLPVDIWNLKSLSFLNISSNILSAFPKPLFAIAKKISSSVNMREQNDNLQEAGAANSASFRRSPVSLLDSMMTLYLADNRLTEDCFEQIALFANLRYLNLSYNDISEIPEGALARLTRLTELFLSGNGLTKVPAEDFENLSDLRWLYLNNNKLPTLPPELSKLKNLTHLDVGSNLLRYNISNWPYDWNWCYNKKLKYLNFSGNKRFEIKQSYLSNTENGETYDSLLVLKDLKVLGLMDVTLTTPSVPDQSVDVRVRTTSSELDNVGYGVSDAMGGAESVAFRDFFIQKFRGNENEVLICSFDGIGASQFHKGHLISYLAKQLFVPHLTTELGKITSDDEVQDAIRRAFLSLNKDINSVFAAKKSGSFTASSVSPDLASLSLTDDVMKGCCMSVVYLKSNVVYAANLGNIEIVLSKSNGDFKLLSTKHEPTARPEFERIRASGGYVSGDGTLDGCLHVSRGVGFFNFIPHTHSGPSMQVYELSGDDEIIIMGSSVLWDYITYDLAVDIVRQEKDDPIIAAQKLRDHALCYGATERISVTVVSFGDQKKRKQKMSSLYNNLGREIDLFTGKKRRERGAQSGDTALRRLDDEIDPPVGDIALVFTDIKNSTLLWDAYPVAMRSAIKLHNTIMRRQLRIVGGYEVKTEGDSFMVSFPTPTSALLWCFNVQNQLLSEDWPSEILETNECCEVKDNAGNIIFRGLSVRMGIHWGSPVCELDMVTRRMDYFGPMVNRASRIESSADGGQIAVSSDFLHEMEQLYHLHEQVHSGATTIQAAYEGNVRVGDIIEREITSLEQAGCSYFELGERKLKGLETPEMITLAFPSNLAIRFEIFKKRMSQDNVSMGRIIGALPVESVFNLRSLSLRLENICSILNVGYTAGDNAYQRHTGDIFEKNIARNLHEKDVVGLFNHLVTRVENCVANLELRQSVQVHKGELGRIDFLESVPLWKLMDEVKSLIKQVGQSS